MTTPSITGPKPLTVAPCAAGPVPACGVPAVGNNRPAGGAEGVEFGIDRLIDFAVKADSDGLPAPETARRLVHAILDFQDDRLQDDATVLLVTGAAPPPPHSDTELTTPAADDLLR